MNRCSLWGALGIALLPGLLSAPALALSDEASDPTGPGGSSARAAAGAMTVDRLGSLIRELDASAKREGPTWRLSVDGTAVQVMADADHDRMRILVPVARADEVSQRTLRRCMEANFSTALDARYAVARGVLWSTFLHPPGSLDGPLFRSALGQTVTLARTYGTSFRSGTLELGGGRGARGSSQDPRPDSAGPRRR